MKDFKVEGTRLLQYTGTERLVKIPPGVTVIGNGAFRFNQAVVSVEMPDSVLEVESEAFRCCGNLRSVQFSKNLKSIGASAFCGCDKLYCVLPASLSSIGGNAFSRKASLDFLAINILNPYFSIEQGCLIERETKTLVLGCNQSIIPDDGSVVSIMEEAFLGSDFERIEIPNGIETIGDRAFAFCRNLSFFEIPASVNSIGRGVFKGSRKVLFWVDPDNNNFSVRQGCLIDNRGSLLLCGNRAYTIPAVKTIGSSAFAGCEQFEEVTIPDGVTRIEAGAFFDCPNLCRIYIPSTVTEIENGAFFFPYTQPEIQVSCDFCWAPGTWDKYWFSIEEDYTGKTTNYPKVNFYWGHDAAPVNKMVAAIGENVLIGVTSFKCVERYISNTFRTCISLEFTIINRTDGNIRVWMKDFEFDHNPTVPYTPIASVPAAESVRTVETQTVNFEFRTLSKVRWDGPLVFSPDMEFSVVIDMGPKQLIESDLIDVSLFDRKMPLEFFLTDEEGNRIECVNFPDIPSLEQTDCGDIPF